MKCENLRLQNDAVKLQNDSVKLQNDTETLILGCMHSFQAHSKMQDKEKR